MANIFEREENIISYYDKFLLDSHSEVVDGKIMMHELLEEYKILLDNAKRMDKLVTLMESKMSMSENAIYEYSKLDTLSNIHNRQYFDEMLLKEYKCCMRSEDELSLMFLEVDYFNEYVEIYGKLEGDILLKLIADEIQDLSRRPRDVVARYEGHRFAVLMPETDEYGSKVLAERMKSVIQDMQKHHLGAPEYGKITVSIGISSIIPKPSFEYYDLINLTAEALDKAKASGANLIRIIR